MIKHGSMKMLILGLSITSSWGNGHAVTYRSLVRHLSARGHDVFFLERDVPRFSTNRDLPVPPYCRTELYTSLEDLRTRFTAAVRAAHFVMVGSYVPDGVSVAQWIFDNARGVLAFYDIDTPVTLAKLRRSDYEYLHPDLIPYYDIYFSFTGGPILHRIEVEYGSPLALPLYCSADPELYFPERGSPQYDLGYMGTYSIDRQPPLDSLLLEPARQWESGRFVVAGPQYPQSIVWPGNVTRIEHLAPTSHREFYCSQRFTLNVTRSDMIQAGFSPSIRLFEAAACGTPIISDRWEGLDTFFEPGKEILISDSAQQSLHLLQRMSEAERMTIGEAARHRVLHEHTAAHRARAIEESIHAVRAR
ncbi:MAG TPA: glycosyltransferase [Thermodesulfobacteriota bacterium]|nr:glycosyltransferase [Thermodesulfobacteriota bacterium]